MTIDPQDGSPQGMDTPAGDDADARALLAADGDARMAAARWLATRLGASAVLFRRDDSGVVFPGVVAAADPDQESALQRRAHGHLLTGQWPDLDLPAVGHLRGLSASEVEGSFLGAWHSVGTQPSGMLARVDVDAVLWVAREGVPLTATDVAVLADALPLLGLVVREVGRRRAVERRAEQVDAQLAAGRDRLARAHEALDGVALASGNELRDTIVRLRGSLRLASAPDLVPTLHDELVRRASSTVDQLAAQVGDLLEQLDHESARRPQEQELVDLNGVAAWVRDTLGDRIQDRRARLVAHALPTVQGSPSHLRRILLELVVNALEHGGRFVEVVLSTRALPDGTLELSVCDSGPGVPTDLRTAVFAPGFQTAGGAGFGLTRTQLLVQSLGGTISLDESGQGGCRATVVLPGLLRGMRRSPQVDGADSI